MNFDKEKKKSQEQRNQKDSCSARGSPSEFCCLLDMVMRAWSVQVLMAREWILWSSTATSLTLHVTNKLQVEERKDRNPSSTSDRMTSQSSSYFIILTRAQSTRNQWKHTHHSQEACDTKVKRA